MTEKAFSWKNLIGYESDSSAIKNLIAKDSLPPIILFHGREGIGKSLFVAKVCSYLFCESGEACGSCDPCLRIRMNGHPNFLFFDACDKQISSSEIQQIKDHLLTLAGQKSSLSGKILSRVLIIKDVESLSRQSVNKLLKIFEELPSSVHIFLSTSCRFSILPTLRSRCVEYLLTPPSLEQASQFILENYPDLVTEKNENPTEEIVKNFLKLSRGSLGTTLKWLSQKQSSYQLIELFEKENFNRTYDKTHLTVDRLKKDNSYSLEDILLAQEIALNKTLRRLTIQKEAKAQLEILSKKRKELKKLKEIIINKKIKLNKAFVLERLLLV